MERLKELRKQHKLTQQKVASFLDISQQAYAKYELDLSEPDIMTLNKLSKLFNVSIDYLLGRETINNEEIINIEGIKPISTIKIPLLGKIACGKPIFAEEDKESYVLAGTNIQADFCLIASGDSMINARILNGDIVFIRKQEMVTNGEIAAVLIGNEVTLKRIFYYPEKSKLVLQAENPLYEPLVYINEELNEIKILGKAVAFQSDVK